MIPFHTFLRSMPKYMENFPSAYYCPSLRAFYLFRLRIDVGMKTQVLDIYIQKGLVGI